MTNEALLLQLGKDCQRRFDRPLRASASAARDSEIDHVEHIEAEVAEVVVHGLRQVFARERREPRSVRAAPGADLGDDDEVVRVGRQRLADQLVGDLRTIEVAGVDVIDPAGDGLAQHGQGRVSILGWSEYAGPGQLHGAVAEPFHGAIPEGECT